jgi:cytochrome c oxidase subunit IV
MSSLVTQQVSLRTYVLNFVGLTALATVSLVLSGLPDSVAVTLSLVIAFTKAVLVLLFFMHLIEERFSFRFVMLVSTLLVGILIVLTVLDPATRGPYAPAPSENRNYQSAQPRPGA